MLIAQLKQRDEAAFEELYQHYSPALYGVIRKIVRDEETARDLLQDTFIKIWQRFAAYDPEKGRLFTWLLNIARNTAIDAFRRNQFTQPLLANETIPAKPSEEQHEKINDEIVDMLDQIQLLDPNQQAVLNLVYFFGYTQEEAAQALRIPLGTAKTRIRSALKRLREVYSDDS